MENSAIRKHLEHFGLYDEGHGEMGNIIQNLAELKRRRVDLTSRSGHVDDAPIMQMKIHKDPNSPQLSQMATRFMKPDSDHLVRQLASLQKDIRHPEQRHESELRLLVEAITQNVGFGTIFV